MEHIVDVNNNVSRETLLIKINFIFKKANDFIAFFKNLIKCNHKVFIIFKLFILIN